MADVTVIGAGVSGLTTAVCLAEAGHRVRVWTADPPARTTSVVAAALWEPARAEPSARTLAWSLTTRRHLLRLAGDPTAGIRMLPMVYGDAEPTAVPADLHAAAFPDLRLSTPDELPAGVGRGLTATMPLVDMPRYLEHLLRRLDAAGAVLGDRRLESPAEVTEADTVVNCTGLGAAHLTGDDALTPVFGQHVEIADPGLTHGYMSTDVASGEWVSWYPHGDRVVLGGVAVPGRTDPAPDPDVTDRILSRVRELQPALRGCPVLRVRAGLRPERSSVRVERDGSGPVPIVHNYGHGWAGLSLSWGCALAVADLVGPAASR